MSILAGIDILSRLVLSHPCDQGGLSAHQGRKGAGNPKRLCLRRMTWVMHHTGGSDEGLDWIGMYVRKVNWGG